MARQPPFEAYKGDSDFVFVSYAHSDADWVYEQLEWLRAEGINIWYDEGIEPGADWLHTLADTIDRSQGMLLFASPASVQSSNVANEIHFALDSGKPVIVIHREETALPPGLKFALSRQQAVIRSNLTAEGFRQKLLRAVQVLASGYKETVDVSEPIPGFSGRAAIAVMPFKGSSAREEDAYFADGLTEELVTGLQSWRTIPVIARDSTRDYEGDSVSRRRLARELGVGYVLRGSVRRAGNRLRINAQLSDTHTGHQIWAQSFNGEMEDVFDLQDEITQRIIGAIEPEVLEQEISRSHSKPTDDLEAWDLYLRGLSHFEKDTYEELLEARAAYEAAWNRDPKLVHAVAGHAMAEMHLLLNHRGSMTDEEANASRSRARERARVAMQIDQRALPAITAQLMCLIDDGSYEEAVNLCRQALELYPASASTWHAAAFALFRSGQFEKALDHFRLAKRLSPRNPNMWLITNQEGFCHFFLGSHDEALRLFNHSITLKRGHVWPHLGRTLTVKMSGRIEEAKMMLQELLDDVPDFNAEHFREIDPAVAEPFIAGLRELGWNG